MSEHHSPCSDDLSQPTWQGYTSANPWRLLQFGIIIITYTVTM